MGWHMVVCNTVTTSVSSACIEHLCVQPSYRVVDGTCSTMVPTWASKLLSYESSWCACKILDSLGFAKIQRHTWCTSFWNPFHLLWQAKATLDNIDKMRHLVEVYRTATPVLLALQPCRARHSGATRGVPENQTILVSRQRHASLGGVIVCHAGVVGATTICTVFVNVCRTT
jgi:hypothetical protein